jgi:5,5'-dehydrodivanillate O-demethylase
MLKYGIKHPAYPVQELGGLLFAYMGPRDRQPLLPRWDMLVRQDGKRHIEIRPLLHCNWLQAEENSADSTHVYFLHSYYDEKARGLRPGVDFDQRPMELYGFQRFEWGLMKSLFLGGEAPQRLFDRPVIFPNMLRIRNEMHWRVPINDTETRIFHMRFVPTPDGSVHPESEEPAFSYAPSWFNEAGEYTMDTAQSQDGMAWETQGPIWDRTKEHLGSSDRGVAMYREMLFEQIQLVREGGDPMALIWDPARNEMIDMWSTYLGVEGNAPATARRELSSVARGMRFEQVFDETHEVFEVPVGAARPV